jgi:tetraacyldisaccharide 4'-kinase
MTMRAPEFWQKRGLAGALLSPLGQLYGASVAAKARHAKPYRPRARVLCVGNLTTGGSGKTPVALALGRALKARGKRITFLTRGYGGSEAGPVLVSKTHDAAQVGDEALLLAQVAPTIVARDRAQGARLAEAEGAEIIVMDDGHQNFALAKDVSVVVVDGESGFGNGYMIPAGPLREPVAQGLARADAVVLMQSGAPASPGLQGFNGLVLRARLEPEGESLRGQRLFAFAGIGRPEKFMASLEQAGATITGSRFFPDHHPYGDAEIAALKAQGPLITTEKDYVRLTQAQREGVMVLKVRATFQDDVEFLLDRLAPGTSEAK